MTKTLRRGFFFLHHVFRQYPTHRELMSHCDPRHRGSQCDPVRLPTSEPAVRGNMKDQRKNKSEEDFEKTLSLDEQIADFVSDDTQRLRSLTVQELERLLKDKKPTQ